MKRFIFPVVASFVLGMTCYAEIPGFTNPILPYDYSDPDVIRVGETYLMTSSSFNNVPGLQILASRDLVHWEIVDAAIRYRLPGYEDGDEVSGNFVWAPAIREHDGRLWIYYGDPDRGIYCVRSKAFSNQHSEIRFPLEWEEPVLVMPAKGYIDPCPLWDEDGRVWLSHGVAGSRFGLKSVLMMAELTPDGLAVKTPSRIIFDGHEEHPTSEGTKLYKRNGYYYLMHPAGGVKTGWQVVQRSKHIYGPYELKVTLAQGKTAINGPHQGAWVDTPEGEHFFLHFQDIGTAGQRTKDNRTLLILILRGEMSLIVPNWRSIGNGRGGELNRVGSSAMHRVASCACIARPAKPMNGCRICCSRRFLPWLLRLRHACDLCRIKTRKCSEQSKQV